MPRSVFADIRTTRKVGKVDDYFTLLLYYPNHRILLTSGMVYMQQLPAYKIYGTKGCFVKQRADIQEDDLLAGKKPNTPNWGVEAKEKWGVLSTDTDGKISTETIPSLAGNYGTFYEKMANAINHNEAVPTSAKHGAAIIRILEAARASFTEGKIITL
jgi:hypothetical protein